MSSFFFVPTMAPVRASILYSYPYTNETSKGYKEIFASAATQSRSIWE